MSPLPYAPPTKKAPPLGYGGKDGAAVGGGEVGFEGGLFAKGFHVCVAELFL
jgi:hypothetical protein